MSSIPKIEHLPHPMRGVRAYVGRPIWNELRKPFEVRSLRRSPLWRGEGVPDGKGRPVVLVPGFLAGRGSASALQHVLTQADWRAEVAEVGRNAGPAIDTVNAVLGLARSLQDETGHRVSVVGHSRGGQLGRVAAVEHPEVIGQLIVAGTPLRAKYPKYLVVKVPAEVLDKAWRLGLLGWTDPKMEDWVDERREAPFPAAIDYVSVWSKVDGAIDWRLCLDNAATSIQVASSHQGMFNGIGGITGILEGLARLDSLPSTDPPSVHPPLSAPPSVDPPMTD